MKRNFFFLVVTTVFVVLVGRIIGVSSRIFRIFGQRSNHESVGSARTSGRIRTLNVGIVDAVRQFVHVRAVPSTGRRTSQIYVFDVKLLQTREDTRFLFFGSTST